MQQYFHKIFPFQHNVALKNTVTVAYDVDACAFVIVFSSVNRAFEISFS